MTAVDLKQIRALLKVLLHDHLDGGLRPSTILELADGIGHVLPSTDPSELVAYFRKGADSGDLMMYLDTFQHTIAVLQTVESLHRVAFEAAQDLAADGIVYAEVRFAPELHGGAGGLDAAIEAVCGGFADATAAGADIVVNLIVCAMRTGTRSVEVAEAAVRGRAKPDGRVVAFDLAGAETGFPPSDHIDALGIAKRGLTHLTIHASEAPGLELIADALHQGAQRIGHGVRLIEDCQRLDDGALQLGPLATYVRDREIPLELCPSCNVQIGAVPTLADHPAVPFLRAGIQATVNTDNRLMSGVSLSSELAALVETFDLDLATLKQFQLNALAASFQSPQSKTVIQNRIQLAFA